MIPSAVPFSRARFRAETADSILTDWTPNPAEPAHIRAMKLRAHDRVSEFGLPNPKLERWKYTNLPAKLKKMKLAHALSPGTPLEDAPDWACRRMEDVPPGHETYADMMLWDANTAFLDRAMTLQFTDRQSHSLTMTGIDGQHTTPRIFICVSDNADATLFEHSEGQGAYWRNTVVQIRVGKNARLRHYRVASDSVSAVDTRSTHVTVERDGNYESFTFTNGAGLSRNQIHAELLEDNARCSLGGLSMLAGTQHGDTTLLVEHKSPHCESNQLHKTILKDEAHGVFQGKIHVHQIAQKTNGYQLSNNLLLSPVAEMSIKPELEIYADDVKCSHGSTTGALDETPMFYLRSRGLSETEARRLLLEAFIGQATDMITHEAAAKDIGDRAREWLNRL